MLMSSFLDPSRRSRAPFASQLFSAAIVLQGAALAGFAVFQASGAAAWFRIAAAAQLAGTVTAMLGALPGALGPAHGLPSGRRGRRIGLLHGLVVVTALACSTADALATFPHRAEPPGDGLAVLLGCTAGWTLLVIGGWSGWHLASRHRLGLAALLERAVRPRPAPATRRRG